MYNKILKPVFIDPQFYEEMNEDFKDYFQIPNFS